MKQSLPISLLVLVLSLSGGCTTERERQQMAQVIAEADSMNRNYVPMTSDTLLLEACRFYDRHGTANERMRAHYLLGCVYRDLEQLPHALNSFHNAVECADTSAENCDFKTLSRVYGQMGALFYCQQLPYYALHAFQKAYSCSKKTDETWVQISFYEQQGKCYYDLQFPDSAMQILKTAVGMYLSVGDTLRANTVKGPLAYMMMQKGDFSRAKEYISSYEYESIYSSEDMKNSDNWKLF